MEVVADNAALNGADSVSRSDIWTVGWRQPPVPPVSFTAHWDGSAWADVDSSDRDEGPTVLNDVAAASSSDVWAVGRSGVPSRTLIEHWDGNAWDIVSAPSPGHGDAELSDVSEANGSVWAAGWYETKQGNYGDGINRTLVLRRCSN